MRIEKSMAFCARDIHDGRSACIHTHTHTHTHTYTPVFASLPLKLSTSFSNPVVMATPAANEIMEDKVIMAVLP